MRSLALAAIFSLLCITPATASPSSTGRLEFEVLRNGQPFGRHTVTVSAQEGGYAVQSQVALRVGAGPLTLFRYEQSCDETWRSGALAGLNCNTLKEGRRTLVRAQQSGGNLRVTGARGEGDVANAWPTSWWTKPPVGAETLLNTETGANAPMRVTRVGQETIDVGGQRIQAERIRVQGSITADLWYDQSGRWVGCTFTARGQRITYRLTSPLAAAPA